MSVHRKNQFDFQKVLERFRFQIPRNLEVGTLQNHILKKIDIDSSALKYILSIVKDNILNQPNRIRQCPQRLQHLEKTLQKLAEHKYDFIKNNIKLGTQINQFYSEANIPLPPVQNNYECQYCKTRSFKKNQQLVSHYKGCRAKRILQKCELNLKEEFQEVKIQEDCGAYIKPKIVGVTTICTQHKPSDKKQQTAPLVKPIILQSNQSFKNIFFQDDE